MLHNSMRKWKQLNNSSWSNLNSSFVDCYLESWCATRVGPILLWIGGAAKVVLISYLNNQARALKRAVSVMLLSFKAITPPTWCLLRAIKREEMDFSSNQVDPRAVRCLFTLTLWWLQIAVAETLQKVEEMETLWPQATTVWTAGWHLMLIQF